MSQMENEIYDIMHNPRNPRHEGYLREDPEVKKYLSSLWEQTSFSLFAIPGAPIPKIAKAESSAKPSGDLNTKDIAEAAKAARQEIDDIMYNKNHPKHKRWAEMDAKGDKEIQSYMSELYSKITSGR